jgi:NAD(P)H-hydrate epimerase
MTMDNLRLTRAQVREVDRRAIEVYGMSGLVLMENAGRGCADRLGSLGIAGPLAICCGHGNNGGDGFVIARHLQLRGYEPRVLLAGDPAALRGDAAVNYRILQHCEVPIARLDGWDATVVDRVLDGVDWIVDALLGTGAFGEPRAPLDRLIPRLNELPVKRLAIDIPSGLDCDTGEPARNTFRADHTCTFVAAKAGFAAPSARDYLGCVVVLDIGAPPRIVREVFGAGSGECSK